MTTPPRSLNPGDLRWLEVVVHDRLSVRPAGSYSAQLASDRKLLARKVIEEATEFALEVASDSITAAEVTHEAADLLYHVMVAISVANVQWCAVVGELIERHES